MLFFMVEAYFLVRYCRREFQILHIHESHWIAGFGAWLGTRLGLPVVVKEASFPVLMPAGSGVPFSLIWERCRTRPFYIAQTEAAAQALRDRGVSLMTVIPNGVEVPLERADPAVGQDVLYIGNLYQGAEWKAFDILFDAWKIVMEEYPLAKLIVAGGGDLDYWRFCVAKLGLRRSVEFMGFVSDVGALYRRAALFVLPSRREGMSNALLEAQSWGIPAVVSDIPGNTAVVEDGENGLVVPVGSSAALAGALLKLLHDPELRVRMGRSARARIQHRFGFAEITNKLEKEYQQILRKASATGLSAYSER